MMKYAYICLAQDWKEVNSKLGHFRVSDTFAWHFIKDPLTEWPLLFAQRSFRSHFTKGHFVSESVPLL